MKKSTIMEGLNNNSTFNKMKEAFASNDPELSRREQEERQKWISDSEEEFRINQKERKPQIKELSEEERLIVLPMLIKYLKRKTSDTYHITADQIIRDFNNNKEKLCMKNNLNVPRLMKLTAYIRYMGIEPLISGSSGYFISSDPYVIMSCVISLEQRAEAILAAANGMRDMANQIILINKNKTNEDPFGFEFD
jgi:hypothetical protein